jgi:hypothetical protein
MSYSVRMCSEGPGLFLDHTCPLKQGCGRSTSVRNKNMWESKLTKFWWYVAAYCHSDVPAIPTAEWQDVDLCIGLVYILYQENTTHSNGPHVIKFSTPWYDTHCTWKKCIREKFVFVTTNFLHMYEVRRGVIAWNRGLHKKLRAS